VEEIGSVHNGLRGWTTNVTPQRDQRHATASAQMAGGMTPEKGRPPPGGEEAEVVVYQPRGVGLIHTRHKPSNTHYTHADTAGSKSSFHSQQPCDLESCSTGQVTWTAT
jgi:hypothetical protein